MSPWLSEWRVKRCKTRFVQDSQTDQVKTCLHTLRLPEPQVNTALSYKDISTTHAVSEEKEDKLTIKITRQTNIMAESQMVLQSN